jgi:mRNA-degrading endonuclease RelE of RelBE toxin-antitoxin system
MTEYRIKLLKQAEKDFYTYVSHISVQYGMPTTALKHYEEISALINSLKANPERYAIRHNLSLQQFGTNVRRVNYKKMAIIYTIQNKTVYIHRIIAGKLL